MDVITLYEFAEIVGRIRRLQAKYAETRQRNTLDSIQELERQIDVALVRIQANANELNKYMEKQNVD